MASAQNEPVEVPGFSDLRIVLLGVSGAGKSSTGNAIMGRKVFKESRTRESEIQRGRVEDRNISIIDTPGFFNTHLTDEEMKKQMMKSLYLSDPGPQVFLLVVNLENFREDERNIVKQIQENFGEESLLFTMVLFIGREKISKREFNQIIESEETQKILNYFEGRFHVINNKNECDSSQITKLLKSIDNMVKNNGGQNYSNEIYLKNQIQLRETMKQEEEKKQEQKKEINTKEYVKIKESMETETEDTTKYQEDMSRESREPPEHKHLRDKSAAVREDHRIQIETWREKQRVRWELERGMTPGDVSKQDLRIVVLGKTGAGKTATRNIILDRKASFVKLSTKICKTKEADVCGRTISIIDTPGFLDDSFHNDQLKAEIERYVSAPGPHVFLLVISLWYSNTMQNTVKWFQENIEQDALNHTIILFTSIDWMSWLKYPPLDEYIRTNKDVKSLIDNCGGRYHSLNNKDRQNRGQVTELLEKIDELVERNGGGHYTRHNIFKRVYTVKP